MDFSPLSHLQVPEAGKGEGGYLVPGVSHGVQNGHSIGRVNQPDINQRPKRLANLIGVSKVSHWGVTIEINRGRGRSDAINCGCSLVLSCRS